MPRNVSKAVATLLAAILAAALAAPPAAQAAYSRDQVVYAACYIFTPAGDRTAMSFPPHRMTAGTLFNMYPEAQLQDEKTGQARANGYVSGRCNSFETPEEAEAWYRASGYNMVKRLDWPKGFWPEPNADPLAWVACLNSHETGVYITPAFRAAEMPTFGPKLSDDALARWGSNRYVDCKRGPTREEVERKIRGAYNVTPRDWPLPWAGGKVATAPPPKPSSKPGGAGSLTVKTDTSAKDAAKAWDEQVKKTLAAEAQKKVETAAKQVQADAKLKADYEAFFAERRKQGRAQ
jgi:hypothetical protein